MAAPPLYGGGAGGGMMGSPWQASPAPYGGAGAPGGYGAAAHPYGGSGVATPYGGASAAALPPHMSRLGSIPSQPASPYGANHHPQQYMPNLLHPSPSQGGGGGPSGYGRDRLSPGSAYGSGNLRASSQPTSPSRDQQHQQYQQQHMRHSQKFAKQPTPRHRARDVSSEPPPPIGGLFDQQFVASPAPHGQQQGFAPMEQSPAQSSLRAVATAPGHGHTPMPAGPGMRHQAPLPPASSAGGVFARSLSTPAPTGAALFGRATTHTPLSTSPPIGGMSPTSMGQSRQNGQAPRHAVTVFGFAPDDASFVLSEFEQYGTIVRKNIEPGANWMHLTYDTPMQAEKALSKNGHTFAGKIMVGVRPCTDEEFTKKYLLTEKHRGVLGTPTPRKLTRSKPGAASAAASPTSARAANTPSRTAPYLSSLTDYLFGW
eukprot:m.44651 g.44651  ORF g.44651 m.44651 type:complete len:429 (+) comp11721_c0_seq2:136-1422(+)